MSQAPDLADLGLQPSVDVVLDRDHALRVARTLDLDDGVLDRGTLPLTWIWTWFTPTAATAALREDGHPSGRAGGPLAGLDRRMFVGGRLERAGDVEVGAATRRRSAVLGVQHKEGSTGPFVVVDVEHRYEQGDTEVLVERQQVLYRQAPTAPVDAPGPQADPPPSAGASLELVPDERLLFRYSALTFNTHRIHYDLPYATGVEGYPGLVVHGPLTATLLAHLAERELATTLTSFSFRATSPTFAGVPLRLVCDEREADAPLGVRAVRADGVTAMTATAHG